MGVYKLETLNFRSELQHEISSTMSPIKQEFKLVAYADVVKPAIS